MKRYQNEVKLQSVLSGQLSIVTSTTNKSMIHCMSKHSLRNAVCYVIAVLCSHFVIGEEMNKNNYKLLSDDTKNTIKLVKKLSNNDKVMPIHPDQIYSMDDRSLFISIGTNPNKKKE